MAHNDEITIWDGEVGECYVLSRAKTPKNPLMPSWSSISRIIDTSATSQYAKELARDNTYNYPDGLLQLRLFQVGLRRTHMRVHVHYDSFHRQCKSYVGLNASLEAPADDRISPTSHLPFASHRPETPWYPLLLDLQSFAGKDYNYFDEAVDV